MIAIQALTGVYPYELQDDPNTGEILWEHLREVDPAFAEVINKMTRYHFKERYQNVDEVIQALKELPTPEAPDLVESNTNNGLYELTLEWVESNDIKTYKITNNQFSKIPGKIRIGRDPPRLRYRFIRTNSVRATRRNIFSIQKKKNSICEISVKKIHLSLTGNYF